MTKVYQDLYIAGINQLAIRRTVYDWQQIAWHHIDVNQARDDAVVIGEHTAFCVHSLLPFDPRHSDTTGALLESSDIKKPKLVSANTSSGDYHGCT